MTQQSLRKVRGFVVDQQTGKPVANVVLLFEAKATDNNVTTTFPLGVLVTDGAGYASFDLTPYPENKLPQALQITPLGDEASQFNLNATLVNQPESRIHFVLKVDSNRVKGKTSVGLASIQNPDDIDREVSPYSFTVKSVLTLGEGDCQTPIPTPFPLRDFRFGRVVLTTSQSIDDALPSVTELDPTVDFGQRDSTSLPLRVAEVLEFRQCWFPLTHSLGQIVYSVPLAPCESVNLAMIDWSREDTILREDRVQARESLFHDQRRDRTIEETVGAALKESQTGFSLMGGYSHADSAGASATVPIYGIPVNLNAAASNLWSLGGAIAHTNGSRDITADSLQELHDRVRQATSVVRTLNSTVVIQATQQEQNVIQTRTVTNHNHCHALTVQYYEVLRNFKIVTEFEGRRRVVLIPYKVVSVDWKIALRFESLLKAVLLDPSLAGCFEAIMRLHLCPQIYPDSEQTTPATGSGGTTPEKPTPKIKNYELTLTTGKAKEAWGRKFGESWGPVYVRLILKNGEEKSLFVKPNISDPGGFAFQYEKDYTVSIGFPNECVGLNPFDIKQVSIRWMESNADDAWGFQKIKIRYQLEGEDQLNYTLLDASDPIYLKWFDDPPQEGLFWAQAVSAPPVISPIEEPVITEELGAPTGAEQRPARLSKKADECCEQRLLAHLNGNIGYYNRAIWLLQDPVERRILLEGLLAATGLADLIDEMPVAVSGRYVAFPLDDPRLENVLLQPAIQGALSRLGLSQDLLNEIWNRAVEIGPREIKKPEPLVNYVSLPTRGLFAEAQLGHCNSCEVRDVTRFWKWDESPCEKAPTIEGITPGPKGQLPDIPQPASLPNPVVQVMQAPAAPDPVGLAAALKVLGTPDIFRDMSGLAEVSQLLGTLASGAVTSTQEAQKLAQQAHDKLQALKAQAATQSGGAQQKQTPTERVDNLQVAKLAAQSASELGMSPEGQQRVFENVLGTNEPPEQTLPANIRSEGVGESYRWIDLISFKPPQNLLDDLAARGLSWQKIENGLGGVNLDLFVLEINRLPEDPASGIQFTEEDFAAYVRKNFASILIRYPGLPGPSFEEFEQADQIKWQSNNPLGAVMKFRIDARPYAQGYPNFPWSGLPIPEFGLVQCAEFTENQASGDWHWRFVTVKGSGIIGYHPVSGTREFGLKKLNQSLAFYIKAADRVTTSLEYAASPLVFGGAEAYWNGFFANLATYVKTNGGDATMAFVYSQRHDWNRVRQLLFGASQITI